MKFYELSYKEFFGYDKRFKERIENINVIGYFSTKLLAKKAIEKYSDELIKKCKEISKRKFFKIKIVNIKTNIETRNVFLPYYECSIINSNNDYCDFYLFFDPQSSREAALEICNDAKDKNKLEKKFMRMKSENFSSNYGVSDFLIDKLYF